MIAFDNNSNINTYYNKKYNSPCEMRLKKVYTSLKGSSQNNNKDNNNKM